VSQCAREFDIDVAGCASENLLLDHRAALRAQQRCVVSSLVNARKRAWRVSVVSKPCFAHD
jgi:hypothetical protein